MGEPLEEVCKKPKTIIVLGPARSGTSIVSGALHHLGVYMGKRASRRSSKTSTSVTHSKAYHGKKYVV